MDYESIVKGLNEAIEMAKDDRRKTEIIEEIRSEDTLDNPRKNRKNKEKR